MKPMRIYLKDMTEMLDYTSRNKDLIFRIIHKKIRENIYKNVDHVHLFDIFLTDYSIAVENIAMREEWIQSLELGLEYFEQQEEYETCAEIKKTIELITT